MPPLTMNPAHDEFEVDYDKNITKLYDAITKSEWDVAIAAVAESPQEAETWVVRHYEDSDEIMWRFLPIHSACARQPPSSVISALLKAYPKGTQCVDDQGMYPLHYACGNQASREVVRLLLSTNPDAAKIPDPRGMLPIHYLACWGPSSVSVIDMVMVANRDVSEAKDSDGNTPLDLALEGEYPERDAVVSALRRWLVKKPSKESGNTQIISRNYSADRDEPTTQAKASPEYPNSRGGIPSPSRSIGPSREAATITINRLRQELTKAQAEKKQNEEEFETRMKSTVDALSAEKEELESQVTSVTVSLSDAHSRIGELETDLRIRSEEVASKEIKITELNDKLTFLETECDELRQTLTDVTDDCDRHRGKADYMSKRLVSLSASLSSLMEAQQHLMKMVQTRDSRVATNAALRRAKLEELLSAEEEFMAELIEKTDDETSIDQAFEKQIKEMDSIASVIDSARQET